MESEGMNSSTIFSNDSSDDTGLNQLNAFDYSYLVLAIGGMLLSCSVIIIVGTKKVITGQIPKVLLINQCCSDCACCLVRAASLLSGGNLIVPQNAFGTFLCRLMQPSEALYWSLVQVSENNLILFTIEQYISVVHPSTSKKLNVTLIGLLIVLCWILGFVYEIGGYFEADREGFSCVQVPLGQVAFQVQGTEVFVTFYILPFVVMVYCYYRIIRTLQQSSVRLTEQNVNVRQAAAFRKIKQELSYAVCILGGAFLILFAPNAFSYYMYTLSVFDLAYDHWFYRLTAFLVNMYFVIGPLSYMIRIRAFRREIIKVCCCTTRHPNGTIWPESQEPAENRSRTGNTYSTTDPTNHLQQTPM